MIEVINLFARRELAIEGPYEVREATPGYIQFEVQSGDSRRLEIFNPRQIGWSHARV